jgi:hypothetical protein
MKASSNHAEMLTIADLVVRWHMSRHSVVRRIETGELPAIDFGINGKRAWRFKPEDVERYERRNRY